MKRPLSTQAPMPSLIAAKSSKSRSISKAQLFTAKTLEGFTGDKN